MLRKWFVFAITHPEPRGRNVRSTIVSDVPRSTDSLPSLDSLPIMQFYLDQVKTWAREAKPGDFFHLDFQDWTLFCVNAQQPTHLHPGERRRAIYNRADKLTEVLPRGNGTLPSTVVRNAALELAADGRIPPGYNHFTDEWEE